MQRSSGRLSTFSIQRAAEESRATEIPQAVKIMYHSQGWDDPSAPYRLEKPNTPEVEVGARAPTGSAKLCADNRRNYLNTVTSCRTLLDLQIEGSKVEIQQHEHPNANLTLHPTPNPGRDGSPTNIKSRGGTKILQCNNKKGSQQAESNNYVGNSKVC